jgi:hypothetical protein
MAPSLETIAEHTKERLEIRIIYCCMYGSDHAPNHAHVRLNLPVCLSEIIAPEIEFNSERARSPTEHRVVGQHLQVFGRQAALQVTRE